MALPFDQMLVKLRLLIQRNERHSAPEIERLERELILAKYVARMEDERLQRLFQNRCEELGYCAGCEKPLEECDCVWVAGMRVAA